MFWHQHISVLVIHWESIRPILSLEEKPWFSIEAKLALSFHLFTLCSHGFLWALKSLLLTPPSLDICPFPMQSYLCLPTPSVWSLLVTRKDTISEPCLLISLKVGRSCQFSCATDGVAPPIHPIIISHRSGGSCLYHAPSAVRRWHENGIWIQAAWPQNSCSQCFCNTWSLLGGLWISETVIDLGPCATLLDDDLGIWRTVGCWPLPWTALDLTQKPALVTVPEHQVALCSFRYDGEWQVSPYTKKPTPT